MQRKKIVVLGSGFGAFSCLKKLKHDYYDIIAVSPRNHFLFTPLLASTTVGTIEFRSIIEPIRNLKHIQYYQAYCQSIDFKSKKIYCIDKVSESGFELIFDLLVIAVGEITNTYDISGVREYAYFLREVSDARKIRVRVIECFEYASLPELNEKEKKRYLRFVVCGGGPTGVEFAAELHDFIEMDVKKKYPDVMYSIEVIVIEAGHKILNTFDEKLSEYTMKLFKREKITIKTQSYVTKVTEKEIYVNDGSHIEYGLLVWVTGNTATDFVKKGGLPLSKRNRILVNEFFKVKDYDDVYALGDCSECKKEIYPATAQVAQQEGKYLAKSLNQAAKNKKVKPFSFRNLGMLAYIGGHKALADIPQFKSSGFKAYLFWRSVYLTKLVSLKNKILVLFDWFKTFAFGRDVSNF